MIVNTQLENKGNLAPYEVINHVKNVDTVTFYCKNNVRLQLTVLRDSMFRFRYSTSLKIENDFSYAITKNIGKGFKKFEISQTETSFIVSTDKLACHISKANLHKKIYETETGSLINEDELGFHWEESYEHGGEIVKMSKVSPNSESFYGLGDKPENLNLKGKRFENWATDSYAFGKHTDPIYKAIPFYLGLHHEKAYGIFFDNSFRTFFDFCQERRNVTSFWAHGGEMNYYFIYGPEMSEVVINYTDLTGKPQHMPPLWALGYHQSKWSYYPESNVKEITKKFRALKIPCDAIYLDIDYMDGFRCFTWDNKRFPNPKKMVAELEADGFKTVVIIDPGIKIDADYSVFKEALEKDYFCKRADGPYIKGNVWPGECYFPDFTNPEVREWWAGLFKELVQEIGVHGVWNDMNEPAVMDVPNKSFPNDVRHHYDGNFCSHRKAHNIYGMQMVRATYKGLKKFNYPKRPFVITRSAYAGTQRYSSTWTGDNVASWEHLSIANIQAQRMCLSGYSFVGSDIGGFAEQPNGELFARWIQLGVFHPFCRTHSSGDHGHQEPWAFSNEITDVVRKFIEIRYQLLPYLYTCFWNYFKLGTPILKSLFVYDQADIQTHYRNDEFIFGTKFLICPILEPNTTQRRMYFPKGNWYSFWDNSKIEGGHEMLVDAPLDQMPIYILEGSIIPKYPIQQYVGEKKIEQLKLEVYYKLGEEKSQVYEDEHDGYDYTQERYSMRNFHLTGKENDLFIQQFKQGKFIPDYETFEMVFHHLPFQVKEILVDHEKMDISLLKDNKTLIVPKQFTTMKLIG